MKAKSRGRVTFSRREKLTCILLGLAGPIAAALLGMATVLLGMTLMDQLNGAIQAYALNYREHHTYEEGKSQIFQAINAVKDKLVILTIDDETLKDKRFNEWPIPRTRYAEMIPMLDKAGARAIAIDVLFLDRQQAYAGADAALKKALAKSKNTIIVDMVSRDQTGKLIIEEPLDTLIEGWTEEQKRERIGVTYEEETGSKVTGVPLVLTVDGKQRFSFDALLAARGLDLPLSAIRDHSSDGFGSSYVKIGQISVPVVNGAMQINYQWPGTLAAPTVKTDTYGDASSAALSMNYIPMSELWKMSEADRVTFFKDRLVLIGVTVKQGHDIKETPLGKMAGMEVHANALLTILSGQFLFVLPMHWLLAVSFGVCLLLAFMLPRFDPRLGAVLTLSLIIALAVPLPVYLVSYWNIWLPPALPLCAAILAYSAITFHLIIAERRAKELMKTLFQKATPVRDQDVIDFLLSGKQTADEFETKLEVRERTVLFSDIRDYTVMSESMDADKVMMTLNSYYSEMGRVINECGGKIWEYVGDAQMVLFGEPQQGHVESSVPVLPEFAEMKPADQAVHASCRMVARLEELNAESHRTGSPVLDIGIGINSGPVSIGTIVNKGKLTYAAIGDTTNVSARMQAMSKDLKCRILISKSTFDKLEDIYLSEKVENVKVKGKAEPMTVYRIFAGQQARERENVTVNA